MKKLIFALCLIMASIKLDAATDVQQFTSGWTVGALTVSTNTVSTVAVSGMFAYPGRYGIVIQNTDSVYDVAIGTSPFMTFAQGYLVKKSSDVASIITLPLFSGTTVWAIGQNNSIQGTINMRVMEFK